MKNTWKVLIVTLVASVAFVACDKSEQEAAPAPDEPTVAEEAPSKEEVKEEKKELAKVEVADEGTTFEPPVQKAQLPEGVWICDMGTVHYARSKESDERCPLCNMRLVKHPPEAGKGAHHGHHHDHDHAHDHDHDHGHDHDHAH